MNDRRFARHLVVIPCASSKVDHDAPAAQLYDSANFHPMLRSAQVFAADMDDAKVMILSAKHGLVELDQVLSPYDVKMGQAGCIDAVELVDQLVALAPASVTAMLPAGYFQPVWEAVSFINEEGDDADPWIDLMNAYEAAPGIGFQRGVASALVRLAA